MRLFLAALFVFQVSCEEINVELYFNETGCQIPALENGRYMRTTVRGGLVTYAVCDLGYALVGDSLLKCNESTGNLTSPAPECQGCKLPDIEHGGYVDISRWRGGLTLYSVCAFGYRLVGEPYHTCNITTGELSNNNNTCDDIDECSEQLARGNGTVERVCDVNAICTNTNGSFKCDCNPGYSGNGTHCRDKKYCKMLQNPKNGVVTLTRKIAHYTCNEGYQIFGYRRRFCKARKWDAFEPACLVPRGTCKPLAAPTNGWRLGKTFNYGDRIGFRCKTGYYLTGSKERKCTRNGWTGLDSHCIREDAGSISDIGEVIKEKIIELSEGSSTARLYKGGKTGVELIFLIDRSSSITPSSLQRMRDFVMMIIDEFGVDNANPKANGTRVSLVTFGSKTEIVFNLNDTSITGKEIVRRKLESVKPYGGATALRPSFEVVHTLVAPLTRQKAQIAMFIIADGQSNIESKQDPKFLIRDLKNNKGFEMFFIGVGKLKNVDEMRDFASKPYRKHVFLLKEFKDIKKLIDVVVIEKTNTTCGKTMQTLKDPWLSKNTTVSKKGSWPWLARIYDEKSQAALPQCGGVLICQDWMLTTEKCAEGEQLVVDLGIDQLSGSAVKRLTVIGKYVNNTHGVALLEFRSSDTKDMFSTLIQPICLVDEPDQGQWTKEKYLWVAGWGIGDSPERLQDATVHTKLPVVNSVECHRSFKALEVHVPDGSFCAGEKYSKDVACRGDIGGPIMRLKGGVVELMGLASQTEMCAESFRYGLFTGVLSKEVVSWIHTETGRCNVNLRASGAVRDFY